MHWFHLLLTGNTESVAPEQTAQGAANELFNMVDMFSTILLVMLLGCAAYGFYTIIRLRREMVLFPNKFMYPGNCGPDDCLEPTEFIFYILPRLTVLSSVLLVLGIAWTLNTYVFHLDHIAIDIASIILPVSILAWYAVIQRKAAKLYWGQ